MKRKKLWFESLLITLLTFVVLFIFFTLINISFKPLNYIVNTIAEINLNDIYFSSISNQEVDTNIILVNIDDLDRQGINVLLTLIEAADPKVIGMDIFFSNSIVTPHDSALKATINRLGNKLVLAQSFTDLTPNPDHWTLPSIRYGHADILTNENNTRIVREFEPFIDAEKDTVWAFGAEIAHLFNPASFDYLKSRGKHREMIHYIGGADAFRVMEYSDVMESDLQNANKLKNKIVILGFLGSKRLGIQFLHDAFYTPVGFDFSANRRPDMHGVVVHANIISMLLNQSYIKRVPGWVVYLITFVILYFHILFFVWVFIRIPLLFSTIALLTQAVSFILVLYISFLCISHQFLYLPTSLMLVCIALSTNILQLYHLLATFVCKLFKWNSIFYSPHTKPVE